MLTGLKQIRTDFGITQREAADRLEIPYPTYRAWEQCLNVPRSDELVKLSDYFKVSIDDLFGRTELPKGAIRAVSTPTVEVPLYGTIAAGWGDEPIETDETYPLMVPLRDRYPHAFMLRVRGNSMDKVIKDGMLALIDPDSELHENDIVAAFINGNEATLKRYVPLANGIMLSPDSFDPTYKEEIIDFADPAQDPWKIVGKLVWFALPFDFKL